MKANQSYLHQNTTLTTKTWLDGIWTKQEIHYLWVTWPSWKFEPTPDLLRNTNPNVIQTKQHVCLITLCLVSYATFNIRIIKTLTNENNSHLDVAVYREHITAIIIYYNPQKTIRK